MKTAQQEIEERANLAGSNRFELLLFRLGETPVSHQRELFGINVFKVREILVMPPITDCPIPEAFDGVANIRGQIIPVVNLPAVMGCDPKKGLTILMVTEFARTVQAFAVEDVREIVQIEWGQVLPAEDSHASPLVTGIARLDGATANTRLAQVLDVEQILKMVMPVATAEEINREVVGPQLVLPADTVLLAADDSAVARSVIELGLKAMGVPFIMTRTGKEAWERLQRIADEAQAQGKTVKDRVAVVLSDLEMPEMDGFTLTRMMKQDHRFKSIPVIIHSSLTGTTNENHVKRVGADAYVAKFAPRELAATIRRVLTAE